MRPYLWRGALAGLAGSVASALVLVTLGERSIGAAIDLEEAATLPGAGHEELYSRGTQVIGGAIGVMLVGLLLGVVFGVVFAATRHRLGSGPMWRRARRLGVAAFVAVPLVPFLKYPANPPAVGDPETVGTRTVAYLTMVVVSVLAVVLGMAVHDRLRRAGRAEPPAQALAALVWLAVVGAAFAVLPASPDTVNVPADLLWSFRLASIGGQAAFWAVTGTVFGLLGERAAVRHPTPTTAGTPPGGEPTAPLV